MKCDNCGKEIEGPSKYCEYCGFELEDEENGFEDEESEKILNISKNEIDTLKESLKEKNERIESFKKDIREIRINENKKSKSKITTLVILLLVSIFIIIVISIRLSISSRYGNNIYSENSNLLSINKELEKENKKISKEYEELEEKYLLLEEESNNTTNSNILEENDEIIEVQTEKEAPKIKLEIYDGPFYDEPNNICYYRIRAIVAGNPRPEITFSKDNSEGAWGKSVAQVNLTNPSETYELVVTARNNLGEATDSLVLSWGCNK